jgi:hypothetical protein
LCQQSGTTGARPSLGFRLNNEGKKDAMETTELRELDNYEKVAYQGASAQAMIGYHHFGDVILDGKRVETHTYGEGTHEDDEAPCTTRAHEFSNESLARAFAEKLLGLPQTEIVPFINDGLEEL